MKTTDLKKLLGKIQILEITASAILNENTELKEKSATDECKLKVLKESLDFRKKRFDEMEDRLHECRLNVNSLLNEKSKLLEIIKSQKKTIGELESSLDEAWETVAKLDGTEVDEFEDNDD